MLVYGGLVFMDIQLLSVYGGLMHVYGHLKAIAADTLSFGGTHKTFFWMPRPFYKTQEPSAEIRESYKKSLESKILLPLGAKYSGLNGLVAIQSVAL